MEELLSWSVDLFGITISLQQVLQVTLVGLALAGSTWLLNQRILRWYYTRESISDRNQIRARRVVRFVAVSFFIVAVLRILDIDTTIYEGNIQRSATDDGAPTFLSIHISNVVKALITVVVANVIDLFLEEALVQRFYGAGSNGEVVADPTKVDERVERNTRYIRSLVYILAVILIARDIGINDYYFYKFEDATKHVTGVLDVGNVLNAIAIFLAIRAGLSVMLSLILARYYRRSKVDVGSQFAINRLLTYFVYLIGVLLVIQAAGFDLLVIWTGAAALLVGIGIGLQQTFNDLICGVIILFERSVKVGDVVELTGHQVGTVRKIGTRTSIVETRDDIMIFVPNSKLIGENVTNWSHVERVARFHVTVGVAYGSDVDKVRDVLLEVARSHPRSLKSPGPGVRLVNFGDSSLDFDLMFWSRDFLRIEDVRSDIRFAIDRAFRENGIEIPFPQRDVWVRSAVTTPLGPPGTAFAEEE